MSEPPRHIMLIDDEEVVLDSCLAILEDSEHEVSTASSGSIGLDRARERVPDLVFVDLKMPGMSGLEVLEGFRSLDPTIVCVVFTGFATIGSAVEAMKRGAFDFLAKPFTPEEFRAMVCRGLAQRTLVLERTALQRERDALREGFAAIVSHELRSPLAAVQQNLFLTISELEGVISAEQQQRLERMRVRIGDLLGLVNRWLRGFSLDLVPLSESFRPVALADIATSAVESAQVEAVRKAVTIEVAVDPALAVLGDAGALTEALLNVVGNAVKYSRADGTVRVWSERQGRHVLISVADSGVGVPQEDLPRIFDVFYRGRAGENVAAGAGIGLALTRRIVEAHGGSISATSEPGHGSVFVIALPAHDASAAEPGGTPPQQVPKGAMG